MIITKEHSESTTRSNSIDSSHSNANHQYDLNFAFDDITNTDSMDIDSEDSLDDDVFN